MSSVFDISLVIPAFNEEARLPSTLNHLKREIQHIRNASNIPLVFSEVIIVDDGSTDETVKVAESFKGEIDGLKIVQIGINRGKGCAVRLGSLAAKSSWVLIADADMSVPWIETEKLARFIQIKNTDIAIGSRALRDSQVKIRQSFIREHLGKTFNIFLRVLTGLSFKDTQCGFKLFNREKLLPVLRSMTVDGFAWDVEFLLGARKHGLSTVEVPIDWEHREESRVHPLKDGMKMVFCVIKLRFKFLFKSHSLRTKENSN